VFFPVKFFFEIILALTGGMGWMRGEPHETTPMKLSYTEYLIHVKGSRRDISVVAISIEAAIADVKAAYGDDTEIISYRW